MRFIKVIFPHYGGNIIAEKIRILHFIDTLGAGGSERQLVYLLQNLDQERFESYVVTTYDKFRHYEAELQRLQIAIYSLSQGDLRVVNRTKAVARYSQLMWKLRPQIVHSWLHYPNLIARVARPLCPPHRLITAIRSQYSQRAIRSEKWTQWLGDFRIVISEKERLGFSTHRQKPITVVIPNGIAKKFFEQDKRKEFNTLSLENTFTTLVVARIDPRKGHQTLLEAIHYLKNSLPANLKVIFIGEITDTDTQQLINKMIEDYKLTNIIAQKPTTLDILPSYHEADVSILPSFSEAFPNVVLESLATRTPVIVSDAANQSGIIQQRYNGWVFPTGDSHALAACLQEAWETPIEQRILMGEHGRSVAAQYTIEKMVTQYQLLYERTLNRA